MRNFVGQNEFTWFVGVVEDRDDPIQLGRVRVRCYGWHTEDKHQIPTGHLPWAIPLQGITSAGTSGVGQSPTGLVEGSWVIGFFLDGKRAQEPVIMGSIASLMSEYGDPEKGFYDPNIRDEEDKLYPHSIYPRFIKEPDVNRLARNSNTVHNTSRDNQTVTNIPIAGRDLPVDDPLSNNIFYEAQIIGSIITEDRDDETPVNEDLIRTYTVDASSTVDSINHNKESIVWNEPKTSDKSSRGRREVPDGTYDRNRYHTVYPKNHVFESESGHIKEYDDTPYAERIHESHRTGTHYEIDPDGNKVTHVVGNNYEVIVGTSFVNVRGDVNLTIDSNVKTYIKGDWDIQVDGDVREHIKGNVIQQVDGNQTETVKKNVTEIYGTDNNIHKHAITVTGERTESVSNNVTETYGTDDDIHKHAITIIGERTELVTNNVIETYGANQTTTITENLDLFATRIDLNKDS